MIEVKPKHQPPVRRVHYAGSVTLMVHEDASIPDIVGSVLSFARRNGYVAEITKDVGGRKTIRIDTAESAARRASYKHPVRVTKDHREALIRAAKLRGISVDDLVASL